MIRMRNYSREDLRAFKEKYTVQKVAQNQLKQIDSTLSIDEHFHAQALASRQKIELNNKNTDYNQQLPFKG